MSLLCASPRALWARRQGPAAKTGIRLSSRAGGNARPWSRNFQASAGHTRGVKMLSPAWLLETGTQQPVSDLTAQHTRSRARLGAAGTAWGVAVTPRADQQLASGPRATPALHRRLPASRQMAPLSGGWRTPAGTEARGQQAWPRGGTQTRPMPPVGAGLSCRAPDPTLTGRGSGAPALEPSMSGETWGSALLPPGEQGWE